MPTNQKDAKPQAERFIETAQSLACDDDKERFEKNLGKMAEAKAAPLRWRTMMAVTAARPASRANGLPRRLHAGNASRLGDRLDVFGADAPLPIAADDET